jgi:hypothetical protein
VCKEGKDEVKEGNEMVGAFDFEAKPEADQVIEQFLRVMGFKRPLCDE